MLDNKKFQPFVFSSLLHIMLLLITYFGLPNISNKETEELVISLENLPISDISNVKKQEEKKENIEKDEIKSNKEVPKSYKEEQKLERDKQDKPIENKQEDLKSKQENQIKEKEKPQVKESFIIKEDKKEEIKEKEKPKEISKEKSKNEKSKQNNSAELDSLLKTLENPIGKNTDEDIKKNKDSKSPNQNNQKKSQGNYNDNLPLSLSERDSIGNQIYNSWYFQAGAKDSKEMYVILKIFVNIDGTVSKIDILDINKYNKSSNAYKVFVDSAIRAVKKASPFKELSKERYNAWRELELNFDPRGVIF